MTPRCRERDCAIPPVVWHASTTAVEIRRALDAEAARLLVPIAKRCDRDGTAITEQLVAEHALSREARALHQHVNRRKWEGADAARHVIENEACAIGTALLVYWLGRPHWFCQYRKRSDVAASERAHWDVVRRIEERLAATDDDRFLHLGIVFDPRTWERGYDWTRDEYTDRPRITPLRAHVWIRTTALGIEPITPERKRA